MPKVKNNRSAEYWRRRYKAIEEKMYGISEKTSSEIKAICDSTLANIEKDIAVWYQRFADNNAISYNEALKLMKSKELKEKYCKEIGNLDSDTLQPIFQYYMADRKEKCQDFTPKSLGMLLSGLIAADDDQEIYDMCADCGSLTIQQWNANKGLRFICKEIDRNAIPFLLFNLAVRNINALVIHGDVLKNEDYARYRLISGENYSATVKEEV